MADHIAGLNVKIAADYLQLGKDLKSAGVLVDQFDAKLKGGGPVGQSKAVKEVAAIKKGLADADRQAGLFSRTLAVAGRGVVGGAGFAVGQAGIDSLAGVAGIAGEAVKSAAAFEQMKVSFDVMLGGADKADAMLGSIRDFAASSPLTFDTAAGAARQLVAVGIAADQAVPTLKMLSDVAAASGGDMTDSLRRVTLAYGQVSTAGQLYGSELRQFTEVGIPLIDSLATTMGKPKEMVRSLVEQGRVGFPEVVRAFKSMTEAGGKFEGMGERYGRTFAGTLDRLTDAGEVLKREFGQALIEELGLKGAADDLTRFADRSRRLVDEVRPAIRFVGDLARAGVQVGHEFARAGAIIGDIHIESLLTAVPGLRDLARSFHDVVKDAADFQIDPVKIGELGLIFADTMLVNLDVVQKALKEVGGDLETRFVNPFRDAAESVKKAADEMSRAVELVNRVRAFGDAADRPGIVVPAPTRAELDANMRRVKAGWEATGYTGPKGEVPRNPAAELEDLKKTAALRLGELKGFDELPAGEGVGRKFDAMERYKREDAERGYPAMIPPDAAFGPDLRAVVDKRLAEMVAGRGVGTGPAAAGPGGTAAKPAEDDWLTRARRRLREEVMPGLEGRRQRNQDRRAATLQEQQDERKRNALRAASGLAGGLFDTPNQVARDAAPGLAGGLFIAGEQVRKNEVTAPDTVPGHVVALAADLSKKFRDPRAVLDEYDADLRRSVQGGVMDERTRALAFGAKADELLGPRETITHLPAPIEYGSQEAARMLTQTLADQPKEDLASRLERQIQIQQMIEQNGRELLRQNGRPAASGWGRLIAPW